MNSEEVAAYLKNNPAFFREYGEVLADLDLDGADPFHRRQIEVLRERHSAEQARYEMVVESARNNLALEQSLHDLACSLLRSGRWNHSGLEELLRKQFDIDAARICFATGSDSAVAAEYPSLERRVMHGSSVCDDRVSTTLTGSLFGADSEVTSCAFIPLKGPGVRGVLVLGSTDPARFQPGMGAIYLDRIGELVSAASAQNPG